MDFYKMIQGLSGLADDELQRLIKAIHAEQQERKNRELACQFNLLEDQAGQSEFINDLVRGRT